MFALCLRVFVVICFPLSSGEPAWNCFSVAFLLGCSGIGHGQALGAYSCLNCLPKASIYEADLLRIAPLHFLLIGQSQVIQ